MDAGTCIIRLFVAFLCFSYLICNNAAIPITRTRNLIVKKPQTYQVARRVNLLDNLDKSGKMDSSAVRRMEIEVNDYPGSGANNRHTPRPPSGRGCTDC